MRQIKRRAVISPAANWLAKYQSAAEQGPYIENLKPNPHNF
ncbi:hypothetical protein [Polaromonas sp.]